MLGQIADPVLEFKIKSGLVGRKERFPVPSLELQPGFSASYLDESIRALKLSPRRTLELQSYRPTVLNTYQRRYYASLCGRYRITIDSDLEFFWIRRFDNSLLNPIRETNLVVWEIKYDRAHDDDASQVISRFPFRLTKISKYVYGLQSVLQLQVF